MIQVVVFDVDGVLIRDGVFAAMLEKQGLTRERTASFFQGGPFTECVLGNADLKEAISPFLAEWGWRDSVDDLLRMWFEADSVVNTDVTDVVAHLRRSGLSCFVASTQEAYRAAYLTNTMGLGLRFDGLFFSCHMLAKKPEAAFFATVTEQIGTRPEQILFIDDHQANVDGARAANWNAELYSFGDDIESILRAYQIPLPNSPPQQRSLGG